MKNTLLILGFLFFLVSCGASKPTRIYHKSSGDNTLKGNSTKNKSSQQVAKILSDAENYLGVPYKFGGTTSSGFDCSGFVLKVFEENNLKITRRTTEQAKEGIEISLKELKKGDLLFFATTGGKRVSHVGIVHTIKNSGEIQFIHASTSKGVIISSLNENYWNKAFLFARRVI